MKYPFVKKREGVYRPQIPIIIKNLENGKHCRVLALLDTGADTCIIPKLVAYQLGFNLSEDEPKYWTTGISGEKIRTWKNVVEIAILNPSRTEEVKIVPTFINTLDRGHIPAIIGTEKFLEYFKVILDYPKKHTEINF